MVGNRDNARLAIRARLVQVFAWIFIALTVMQLVLTGWLTFRTQEIVVTAPGGDPGTPLPLIAAAVAGLTPIALLIVALALCAVALAWIHRAHASLREQGIALDNSPGWAVGSYFIPLVNLVAPYRAMRELYNRSHGEVDELAHATVDEVQTWWFTYVIGLTLAMLLAFKGVGGPAHQHRLPDAGVGRVRDGGILGRPSRARVLPAQSAGLGDHARAGLGGACVHGVRVAFSPPPPSPAAAPSERARRRVRGRA